MEIKELIVADDRPLTRWGIRTLLSESHPEVIVREADTYHSLKSEMTRGRPCVLVLDLTLPDTSGLQALKEIRTADSSLPILVTSLQNDADFAARALQAGATGYWARQNSCQDFLVALETVAAGRSYCPEDTKLELFETLVNGGTSPLTYLSEREFGVLQGIGSGRTLTELAVALGLSVKTVSTYRSRLMRKLGLKNQAELVLFAHTHLI